MSISNERAARLRAALAITYPDAPGPDGTLLRLLVDARHLADEGGVDFAITDRESYEHYRRERAAGRALDFACTRGGGAGA